jgi:hypothetical protein
MSEIKTSNALTGGRGLFNYRGMLLYGPPALEAYEARRGASSRSRKRAEKPAPTKAELKKAHKARCLVAHDVLRAMRRR